MDKQERAQRSVIARNPSTGSENRIHADDVARRHGFRGGLVPGVTVYGYLAGLLADVLGEPWISQGRAEVRFRSPCYDGDELILAMETPAEPAGEWAVEVRTGDVVNVTGSAWEGTAEPLSAGLPHADPRRSGVRPVVSREELAPGTVLGSIFFDTGADAVAAYRDKIGPGADLADRNGWIHPGMLLDAANWVLMAHVVMPLWLHVGSTICHHRPVRVGEPIWVRARVAKEWEQKGHRFVTLDVSWVGPGGDDVAATASHTAIWQLGPA